MNGSSEHRNNRNSNEYESSTGKRMNKGLVRSNSLKQSKVEQYLDKSKNELNSHSLMNEENNLKELKLKDVQQKFFNFKKDESILIDVTPKKHSIISHQETIGIQK